MNLKPPTLLPDFIGGYALSHIPPVKVFNILYLLNKRMLREKVRKDVQKVVVCHTGDKINNDVVGIVQISTDCPPMIRIFR